jgi:hypothetical protein
MKHWPFKVFAKEGKPVMQVQYRGEEKDFVRFASPLALRRRLSSDLIALLFPSHRPLRRSPP